MKHYRVTIPLTFRFFADDEKDARKHVKDLLAALERDAYPDVSFHNGDAMTLPQPQQVELVDDSEGLPDNG